MKASPEIPLGAHPPGTPPHQLACLIRCLEIFREAGPDYRSEVQQIETFLLDAWRALNIKAVEEFLERHGKL